MAEGNKSVDEVVIFQKHVVEKNLKHSQKRDYVLQAFLKAKTHVSAEDLWSLVKKKHPEVGYTTVYRTLKLIVSSGLAEKVDFDDGVRRYERKIGREYHAHFICTHCGDHLEVFHNCIEKLSLQLSKEEGFHPNKHRLEIFGLCKKCH
ncbi:hypothetical protein MNBD_UNCLBAC01-1547 [hydrothermal vent metagenome]|uniref:Ferric uptake regulation protein FUR n=1 Tax=hydrothermal vent metagenome TaxID=652676 RepID=A0A3B1E064_9ZZZZ